MTLARETGPASPFEIVCDDCGEVDALQCHDFHGALAKAKSRGWKPVYNAEEESWEHVCPDCKD